MNKQTLTALRGSIRKWEKIVAGTGRDDGMNDCPLCAIFWEKFCKGCPVSKAAKNTGCEGTPYQDWRHGTDSERRADTPKRKRLAQAELDFLKSLLPKVRK